MKFMKFILLAVGAFMVLLSMLWVVINLWWLILCCGGTVYRLWVYA